MADVTDPWLWTFAVGMLAFDAAAVWRFGWTIVWAPILMWGGAIIALAGIGAFYQWSERSDALARLGYAMALSLLIALAGQLATYVLATTGAPFQTDRLRAWDSALGFRWEPWAAWVTSHPWVGHLFLAVYFVYFAASSAVTIALALTPGGVTRYMRAGVIALLVSFLGLLMLPAMSAIPTAPANVDRLALRAGTFTTFDLNRSVGLISFPSMHAALGTFVALPLWHRRRWRPVVGTFAGLTLIATVSVGGHYLVDVIAGALLAVVSWRVAGLRKNEDGRA